MSIADKLITIAENEQRVFEAGKLSLLRESKYMNGSLSGEVVAANDVSAVEHDVSVQLSSDRLTDFSQVTVNCYGKNRFNLAATEVGALSGFASTSKRTFQEGVWYVGLTSNNYYNPSSVDLYGLNGDTITVTPKANGYSLAQAFKCLPNQTYYLSAQMSESADIPVGYYDADGNYLSRTTRFYSSVTTPDNCYWFIVSLTGEKAVEHTFSNIQVSLSPVSGYEPYVEPTIYTANADGTVDGVRSLSPSMTLATDTDGVMIDCSYLRDVDRYIDGLTGGA